MTKQQVETWEQKFTQWLPTVIEMDLQMIRQEFNGFIDPLLDSSVPDRKKFVSWMWQQVVAAKNNYDNMQACGADEPGDCGIELNLGHYPPVEEDEGFPLPAFHQFIDCITPTTGGAYLRYGIVASWGRKHYVRVNVIRADGHVVNSVFYEIHAPKDMDWDQWREAHIVTSAIDNGRRVRVYIKP